MTPATGAPESARNRLLFLAHTPVVLGAEGGYANHADDPGGATNYGVTQKTYDAHRRAWRLPPRDVRLITGDEVHRIYGSYWRAAACPALADAGLERLALVVYDWSINAGQARARNYLQAVLAELVEPMPVDGIVGPRTRRAIATLGDRAAADPVAEAAVVSRYLRLRAAHYHVRAGSPRAAAERALLQAAGLARVAPKTDPGVRRWLRIWCNRLRHLARRTSVPVDPSFAAGTA